MNELEEYAPPSIEQKAFNEIWKRFVIEKHPPGLTAEGRGVWKGVNETRCAIGWLIPEPLFKSINSNTDQSVDGVTHSKSKLASYFKEMYGLEFLTNLEEAHDKAVCQAMHSGTIVCMSDFRSAIKQQLEKIAGEWSLKIPGKE